MTVQMVKLPTLLGNFTEDSHGMVANKKRFVIEQLNYAWHHNFHLLDKFRWKKINWEMSLTVQMTKSLTLLGKVSKGTHSRRANPFISILERINHKRNQTLDRLDKFHWKNMKSTGGPTKQLTKSLALLERPLYDRLSLYEPVIAARKKLR